MDHTRMPPVEPGPEPDTTTAAEPFDAAEQPIDAEDDPAMIDEHGDVVDEG